MYKLEKEAESERRCRFFFLGSFIDAINSSRACVETCGKGEDVYAGTCIWYDE